MNVILPENPRRGHISPEEYYRPEHKFKTLWLLHGGGDNFSCWARKSSLNYWAYKYGIAVIMPDARMSFYFDGYEDGYPMWSFMTRELMPMMRFYFPLSDRREDNYVAGLSMGGGGAAHWAFCCPEQFESAAILSSGPHSNLKLIRDAELETCFFAQRIRARYQGNLKKAGEEDYRNMDENMM